MPRQSNFQINFRTNEDSFMYLHRKENYSQYINDLIDKDRLVNADHAMIEQRRRELKGQLAQLDEIERSKHNNSDQLQQILENGLQKFEQRKHDPVKGEDIFIGDSQNRDWIKKTILPDVKKAGGKLDEYKILEMFKSGRVDAQ